MFRALLFLLGFGFSIIGFIYIIAYLNYLSIGYTFLEYILFCLKRWECLLAIIGLILIGISIFAKGKDYDIRI